MFIVPFLDSWECIVALLERLYALIDDNIFNAATILLILTDMGNTNAFFSKYIWEIQMPFSVNISSDQVQ